MGTQLITSLSSVAFLATASVPGINKVSVPLIGVPLTVIFMAGAGSLCAIAWTQGDTSRGKLFLVTLASTFVGASCVGVVPHAFGVKWPEELQAPLALLFGLLTPWVVPAVKGAIPAFFKGLAAMIVRIMGVKIETASPAKADEDEPKEYTPRKRTQHADESDGEA